MTEAPFGISKIPCNPSFRDSAVNSVAVVPLLARKESNYSAKSFQDLLVSLRRHAFCNNNLLMVVPNTSLTRPGEWRYDETPLKAFHWQHGCQRLQLFDGRPETNKMAHEKLLGHSRNWIDILPSRRTAAIIGILNMRDCQSLEDLKAAKEELKFWAQRYSTPPYEVTVHGSTFERDMPITRLYVFDSFEVDNMDLNDNTIMAFPPTDEAHLEMMDLHLNVVISDLTVAIFCDLEKKVSESNEATRTFEPTQTSQGFLKRYISSATDETEVQQQQNKTLGVSQLAGLVSPDSKLAKESLSKNKTSSSAPDASPASEPDELEQDSIFSKLPKLMTPLDDETIDLSNLTPKDVEALKRRNVARRVKFTADLCLLAGSPLDAYERYLKAAELCKANALDPLWHASALEGCAAAHIAMAEMGGFSVDEYLENNFQLPDEIMALARDDPTKRPTSSATKQTLPEVVFALCDEALNILNRNDKVCHLYAELLLKLAEYCAVTSEAHLRCRWGEGAGCYSGELGDQPRWEKTSVAKLTFNPLKTKDDNDMIAYNTLIRTKYVCELLNRAVSVGGLDPATRVEVALRSVTICLNGVKATHWAGRALRHEKLLRKAAFFATIAAETATTTNCDKTSCVDLWMLATQLYSKEGNSNEGAGGYGWATLRAFCYDCLSKQDNSPVCMEAAVELRSLLADLEPDPEDEADIVSEADDDQSETEPSAANVDESDERGEVDRKDAITRASSLGVEDADLQLAVTSASQFAKTLRTQYNNLTAASPLMGQLSRWANGDPVPPVNLPLASESPLCADTVELKAVWPYMTSQACMNAQSKSSDRVTALQRAIATSSNIKDISSVMYGFGETSIPLYVSSAMTIEAVESLELECIKRKSKKDKTEGGAMATFYNPFDAKRNMNVSTTKVAEDEEIAMLIKFGNRLSIPVEVHRGQLVFDNEGDGRVKAASLSFTVPPNAASFVVHFPFTILSGSHAVDVPEDAKVFEVKGIDLTCFGRSFFVPISDLKNTTKIRLNSNFPVSASTYPHRSSPKVAESDVSSTNPKIEAYPCQPKLQIRFAETGAPVKSITVPLSDGELFSIPPLRLVNYLGPTSKGKIESLEVFADNSPRDKLYDSNANGSQEESEADFVKDLIYELRPRPFKFRALKGKLNLDSVNDAKTGSEEGNILRLQVAAAHNFGHQLPNGATITLNLRYRGPCFGDTEVWRKTQVVFRIVAAKGPRISSITFRPDLQLESSFADLMSGDGAKPIPASETLGDEDKDLSLALKQLGRDSDDMVCHTDSVFVLTIANETRSILSASLQNGESCGFGNSSLVEVLVRPGVSARIPVTIPRISRNDSDGKTVNVLDELVSRTCFKWEMRESDGSGPIKATGYIRIPAPCLHDIVGRYPAFLAQICKPPCSISVNIGEHPKVLVGKPIDVALVVNMEEWVTSDIRAKCSVILELRCVRKDRLPSKERDFAWAGKLRRSLGLTDKMSHTAKLIFCHPGVYVVSGCAQFKHESSTKGETWWAPVAQTVNVPETLLAAE